ncbi:MAG TPA: hypothetical protein VLA20_06020, partial [Vicinamibacterales bacterium]|nr:hypothetical protein [Vicinamibacterales bacterium]
MKRRGLGVLLVLALIVAGGTLGQNLRFNTALANERVAAVALESRIATLDRMVTELRAGQAGYVATGQDPEYWMAQVGTLAGRIENDLTSLVADTLEDHIRGHYEAALLALADFNSIDDRTRNYVGDRQLFLASDLIFMDALDANRRVSAALGEALTRERQAASARETRIGWIRFAMNATALALLLVVALVSVRLGSQEEAAAAVAEDDRAEPAAPLRIGPAQLDSESDVSPPVVVKETGVSRSSLDETAELCADIARLMDG